MLSLSIRYLFISFCIIYTYFMLIQYSGFYHKNFVSKLLFLTGTITLFLNFLFPNYIILKLLILFLFSHTYCMYITKVSIFPSIMTFIISSGISFLFYILSNTFMCLLYLAIYKTAQNIPYNQITLPVGLLQFLFTHSIIKIPQFRYGVSFLIQKRSVSYGISLSLLLILYIMHSSIHKERLEISKRLTIICSLILVSFLLLYYWRNRIKRTYIENMRRLETARYENTIADRDKQIAELKRKNAELGQIVHKYRKTIPAMELSVIDLLQSSTTLSKAEFLDRANALQTQLTEVRNERDNLLDKYQKNTVIATQTGLHTVDALLALMEKRAKQEGIRYKTQIDPTLKELALNSIKESDLLHLLGDLIENAIHAVSLTEDKEILIHLTKLDDCLLLEVSDNGIAFDIQTYQHFGNEPFTSHQSDGGSGTGLMDIWKLKKEYKISLYIYEYSSEHEVYTKKIAFLFDGKNHFLLKTYRDKEIKNALIRGDLHVFSYQTD